jgi:ribose transport system substrate-binding protein
MFTPKPFLYLLLGASLFSPFIASSEDQKTGDKKISIAVVPMGTSHVYWKAVEAGARQACKELGVDMTWKGPLKENDRAQQIAIVEQFVSENKSGIVIAPLDDTALKRPIDAAMAKKIPVVIIDSALKGEPGTDFVSFVATDNHAGGKMAAEELLKLLNGKGKVILIRGQEGTASTTAREEGFLEEIKKHPDIQILLDNRYAGNTAAEAQTTVMNLMDKIRQADGMFCPNEGTTFGTLLALRQAHLAGKIKLVGFDTSPALIEGVKKGEIMAVVAQHPKKMAYDGVKILVSKIRGEEVPQKEDSGAVLITAENLNTPEIQELLAP